MGSVSVVLILESLEANAAHQLSDPKVNRLLIIFNELFLESENTVIELSVDEPLYVPASTAGEPSKILFSHSFFSSALHEISHWLVAGEQRRKLEDYGYWYKPDGRSFEEQQEFEKVEILPQAIEWILSVSCDHRFHFSADNLNSGFVISEQFKQNVSLKAQSLLVHGLPDRMQKLVNKLVYGFAGKRPSAEDFLIKG